MAYISRMNSRMTGAEMSGAEEARTEMPAPALAASVLSTPVVDEANRKNVLILVQLRWIAVVGQILTIGRAFRTRHRPAAPAAVDGHRRARGVEPATLGRLHRHSEVASPVLAAMMFDVTALTPQLWLTGGTNNPFISLYLLQVTLGAVLLGSRGLGTLAAVSLRPDRLLATCRFGFPAGRTECALHMRTLPCSAACWWRSCWCSSSPR